MADQVVERLTCLSLSGKSYTPNTEEDPTENVHKSSGNAEVAALSMTIARKKKPKSKRKSKRKKSSKGEKEKRRSKDAKKSASKQSSDGKPLSRKVERLKRKNRRLRRRIKELEMKQLPESDSASTKEANSSVEAKENESPVSYPLLAATVEKDERRPATVLVVAGNNGTLPRNVRERTVPRRKKSTKAEF